MQSKAVALPLAAGGRRRDAFGLRVEKVGGEVDRMAAQVVEDSALFRGEAVPCNRRPGIDVGVEDEFDLHRSSDLAAADELGDLPVGGPEASVEIDH
jgi:hypothetical protein